MPNSDTPAQVVLVPGAFTGGWMWSDVVDGLAAEGITAVAAELPTIGEGSTDRDFAGDVAAIRALLDDLEAPVVLAAHSFGGAVVTAAAAGPHPNVRELVYVAGAAPGNGQSMAGATAAAGERAGVEPGGPGPAPREDGLMAFPPQVARQALFNDCSDERAQEALDRLRPQSFAGVDTPIEVAAWTQLPAVYVRGEDDLVPRALADGFLEGCEAVVDLPTGHCPHWSRPELVTQVLAERVRAGGTAA